MGQSTNGILVYGYDLAGGDAEWKVREVGEYGELRLDWLDVEENDFESAAEKRLMASVGFTETDYMVDGFFDREREAEARLGVEFKSYCSGEYPMYTLAAKGSVLTAYRGDCKHVDFTVSPEWDDKLRDALAVLGMTPTQEQAQWLLCSWWG
ncbi:hypothetical protein [Streptomyces sp. OK228]|uniref:hypothetical protein n=1 Tax=Streptomyces sp. OK228 TaxID=1882786 RepID=UPI000BD788A6|nr:hypothetical protein [Streptomyces sp. OK228]SOE25676.1 hypothetical protein SAMN05442782_2420 [Streptomyces sp. OK228]